MANKKMSRQTATRTRHSLQRVEGRLCPNYKVIISIRTLQPSCAWVVIIIIPSNVSRHLSCRRVEKKGKLTAPNSKPGAASANLDAAELPSPASSGPSVGSERSRTYLTNDCFGGIELCEFLDLPDNSASQGLAELGPPIYEMAGF